MKATFCKPQISQIFSIFLVFFKIYYQYSYPQKRLINKAQRVCAVTYIDTVFNRDLRRVLKLGKNEKKPFFLEIMLAGFRLADIMLLSALRE